LKKISACTQVPPHHHIKSNNGTIQWNCVNIIMLYFMVNTCIVMVSITNNVQFSKVGYKIIHDKRNLSGILVALTMHKLSDI